MDGFDEVWRRSVRYRHASRELESLMRDVYDGFARTAALRAPLESLLEFLSSEDGRTDANCSTVYYFVSNTEELWRSAPEALQAILDDMSGTLQDSIHAPNIARTFEATPEQLLQRVRNLPHTTDNQ